MKILYTAKATVQGGRNGQAKSSDGHLHVHLSVPKKMGEDGGQGTNPEQLFAAGYAACYQSELEQVARRQHVEVGPTTITANVGIGPTGRGGFGLAVELHIFIQGVDKATAEQLAARVHEVCPYSNATRGNIPVQLAVEEQPLAAS